MAVRLQNAWYSPRVVEDSPPWRFTRACGTADSKVRRERSAQLKGLLWRGAGYRQDVISHPCPRCDRETKMRKPTDDAMARGFLAAPGADRSPDCDRLRALTGAARGQEAPGPEQDQASGESL